MIQKNNLTLNRIAQKKYSLHEIYREEIILALRVCFALRACSDCGYSEAVNRITIPAKHEISPSI